MSVISSRLPFPLMARKEKAATEQVNFRLKTETVEQMEAYRVRHPLHPTMTQVVEAALAAFFAEEEKLRPRKPR